MVPAEQELTAQQHGTAAEQQQVQAAAAAQAVVLQNKAAAQQQAQAAAQHEAQAAAQQQAQAAAQQQAAQVAPAGGGQTPLERTKNPSVSHANQYKQYLRSANNRKKFPLDLHARFTEDPLDLFWIWLENDMDWGQVKLHVSRGSRSSVNSQQELQGQKERDMNLPEAKKTDLIARLEKAGAWKWDPQFPGDLEERIFFMTGKQAITKSHERFEEMRVDAEHEIVDNDELKSLLGPGGILAAGHVEVNMLQMMHDQVCMLKKRAYKHKKPK